MEKNALFRFNDDFWSKNLKKSGDKCIFTEKKSVGLN